MLLTFGCTIVKHIVKVVFSVFVFHRGIFHISMICSKFDYSNSPSMHIKWVHIIHTNTHRYVIRLFIYSYLINNHNLWGLTFIACRQHKTFVIFNKQYAGKSNDERRHFLFWIFRLKTILRQVMKLGYCYFYGIEFHLC